MRMTIALASVGSDVATSSSAIVQDLLMVRLAFTYPTSSVLLDCQPRIVAHRLASPGQYTCPFFFFSFRPRFLIGLSFCRKPNFTISYRELGAAFRMARHLHNPKKFTTMEGDENMLLEAMQGPSGVLAQERQEFERALAQERAQRQKLERILVEQRGMGSAGRASGGSSSSRPGGSGHRFFATLPKPHEAAIAPWRRLLALLPRKW